MAHDSPTQPAWPVKPKRPWWATLVIGGLSAGLGVGAAIATALGLAAPAHGEPPVHTAALATDRQQDEWRVRMEQKLDEALQRIAHIEGRLDRK